MADRAKFLDFLDMIDGGGAGRRGDEFEGGGIFSQLANLVATPYGSEDERRKKMRMEFYLDKLGTPEEQAKAAAATVARNTPSVVKKTPPAAPVNPYSVGGGFDVTAPAAPPVNPYSVGGGFPMTTRPSYAIDNRSGPVYTPAPSYAGMSMGEAGRVNLSQPTAQVSASRPKNLPAASTGYVGVPSGAGVTLGSNMSGGSQPRMPMQEFAPQGQFSPPAESISRMTSSDFAVADYLERNGIPMTMENITRYRPIVMAAM